MRKIILLFALICLQSIVYLAMGVPAISEPREYRLPNGKTISINLHGDEHFNWITTLDGYRITQNSEGYFVYVSQLKSNKIERSNIQASNPDERSAQEILYLQELPKNLGVREQSELAKRSPLKSAQLKSGSNNYPSSGIRKNLLILANFNNKTTTYKQSEFNSLMNQPNYKGIGSFRDYYLENSSNTLDITTTVTVWVTVPNTYLYYSNSTKWEQFAYDAIKAADATVDFSQFETNGNELLGVTIIHQGMGQESSGNTNDIWSHQGQISSYQPSPLLRTFDGVVINQYSMQPEIFNLAGAMSSLGVIVHEFGHLLGLPDFYDTDYEASGGTFAGTGRWDLMAGGAYNGSYNTSNPSLMEGACPSHHNALSKRFLNWAIETKINTPQSLTLNPIETGTVYYKIETSTSKEYYYLENRQKIGFDSQLPGNGMLIYHVDSTWIEQHTAANDINVSAHEGLCFKVASRGLTNSGGCPFPGSGAVTAITDATVPNLKSWLGDNTNKSITNIQESVTGVITFDFMALQNGSPQSFEAKQYMDVENRLIWSLSASNDPVLVAFSTTPSFGAPVDGNTYTAGNTLPGGGTVLNVGLNTSYSHQGLTQNTTYYYKIWSNLGATYSIGMVAQAKTINTIRTFPWKEPIKDTLPNWTKQWVSGTNTNWCFKNGGFFGHPSAVDPTLPDTTIAAISQTVAGKNQTRLITPSIVTVGGLNYRLSFKHAQPAFKTDQDTLRLKIKKMVDTNWSDLVVFTTDIPNWNYEDIDLPNMGEPFQIAFENSSYNGYCITVDSISIIQTVPFIQLDHTIRVKDGSKAVNDATIEFLGTSTKSNSLGEAHITGQDPNRNWEVLKVKANGYEEFNIKVRATQTIDTTLQLQALEAITPSNFTVIKDQQSVKLTWNPVIDESFESYAPWDTLQIGSWKLLDFDKEMAGGFTLFDYPHDKSSSAFVVFDVNYGGIIGAFEPHSGNQMAVSLYSHVPPNNDWMISPQLTVMAGDTFELFARSATKLYGLETMEILISQSANDTASFVQLDPLKPSLDVPIVWTKYSYDLSSYVGKKVYLAIRCTSNDKYALLIDDIKLKNSNIVSYAPQLPTSTTNISTPKESGNIEYQIIRDGAIDTTLNGFEKYSYTKISNDCKTHTYAIQTNYLTPARKSAPSADHSIDECTTLLPGDKPFENILLWPNPSDGNFTLKNIDLPVPFNWNLYAATGELVQSGVITNIGETPISMNKSLSGVYLLKFSVNDKEATRKIIIIK